MNLAYIMQLGCILNLHISLIPYFLYYSFPDKMNMETPPKKRLAVDRTSAFPIISDSLLCASCSNRQAYVHFQPCDVSFFLAFLSVCSEGLFEFYQVGSVILRDLHHSWKMSQSWNHHWAGNKLFSSLSRCSSLQDLRLQCGCCPLEELVFCHVPSTFIKLSPLESLFLGSRLWTLQLNRNTAAFGTAFTNKIYI